MESNRQTLATPTRRRGAGRTGRTAATAALVIGLAVTLAGGALGIGAGPAEAIVAGRDTAISEVPWQVLLRLDGELICGGSLISDGLVLTAAHCTEGLDAADLTVRAGVTAASDDNGQDRAVTEIIKHSGFAEDGIADVSVLRLSEPFRTGDTVAPIDLASPEDLRTATTAVVSGWGVDSEDDADEDLVEQLQSTTVALVDDATCANLLDPDWHDPDQETCTGNSNPETRDADTPAAGSCYGDSGGPLVVRDAAGTPKLVGVVSWGIECGVSPDVYAEVPAFAPWIRSVAAGATQPDAARPDSSRPDAGAADEGKGDEHDERFDESDDWFDDCWDALDEWVDSPTGGRGDGRFELEDQSCTAFYFDA